MSTAIASNLALFLTVGLVRAQVVQIPGDPSVIDGRLDLDQPFVPTGPIAPTSAAITASGLASVEALGTWAASPHVLDPAGNVVGQGFITRNGVLAVAPAGTVLDVTAPGFGGARYIIHTQVPAHEFGLLFTNELFVRYRVELRLAGSSLGESDFSFGNLFATTYSTERVHWRGPGPFDEIRITFLESNEKVGIDQLVWHSVGATIGARVCSPAVVNSSGASASLFLVGTGVVGDLLELEARQLPLNSFGFFLSSRVVGNVQQPGNSVGVLCLGGAIGRFVAPGQLRNSGSLGEFSLLVPTASLPQPAGAVAPLVGEDWTFTAWFRDVAAGGFSTSNFTDAVTLTFQ